MNSTNPKSLLIIAGLILLAILNGLVYWNAHLYSFAKNNVGNLGKRIWMLEEANRFLTFNESVHQELGYAHFQLAEQRLGNEEFRNHHFDKSLKHFIRSIRLNPGKYQPHFLFGQALFHMNYFMDLDISYMEEFRKAADLTYSDKTVAYKVGLLLLARWPTLSETNREFTIRMLKDEEFLEDEGKLTNILQAWASNAGEYELMDQILPKLPKVYRKYAGFLGEKSLSLEERHQKLAQAEFMEFEEAKKEYRKGGEKLRSFRIPLAMTHFRSAYDFINDIHFYQELTSEILIDTDEFDELKKSVLLGMIQCLVNSKGNIKKVQEFLCTYIDLEENVVRIGNLETYLKRKKIINGDTLSSGLDLDKLFCRMAFDFSQHRYRDVIQSGEFLKGAFFERETNRDADFAHIYRMIGDSYFRLDNLYDAIDYYNKALEINPEEFVVLTQLLESYQRLNNEEKIKEMGDRMARELTPGNLIFDNLRIEKGRPYDQIITMTGEKYDLKFDLKPVNPASPLLLSVFLNDKVIWEGSVYKDELSINLEPKVGINKFRIVPVNQDAILNKISFH